MSSSDAEKHGTVVDGYMQTMLGPHLRSLGLDRVQRYIVITDVTMRLQSLLAHWHDVPFRRTILTVGTEEATFWKPRNTSLEIRSLIVVAVRNSLIEDIHATHPYTDALRSETQFLPNYLMPLIMGEAVRYFAAANLDSESVEPTKDLFGSLPRRFPRAWHVLSLLGNSSDTEMTVELPTGDSELLDLSADGHNVEGNSVIASGIDPRLDPLLTERLRQCARKNGPPFFSESFKGITRNPEKLFSIVEHVLRCGGTVLTPNYLLSPTYLARRDPLLRPVHSESQLGTQLGNPIGLSKVHKDALDTVVLF